MTEQYEVFCTVGTHEQPFDRLIKAIDEFVGAGLIEGPVFIQTGFSNYEPKNCEWSRLVDYEKMQQLFRASRIVITHGGPSTFMEALAAGRAPIVVPRRSEWNEHVNNHQVDFLEKICEVQKGIIPCYELEDLEALVEAILAGR